MATRLDVDLDQSRYIAAEVSYTGAARDADGALGDAATVTRVTGAPCEAAIMSVRNDDNAAQEFRDGLIHWYQLEERDLENPDLGGN